MKKSKFLFFLAILISIGLGELKAQNETSASDITENTTWSGTVLVDKAITIAEGKTLTIEAGTKVVYTSAQATIKAGANTAITAIGTAEKPIKFYLSNEVTGGSDVAIKGSGIMGLTTEYCEFSNFNNTVVSLANPKVTVIKNSTFEGNGDNNNPVCKAGAIKLDSIKFNADHIIDACVFKNNKGSKAGAVFVNGASSTRILTLRNCLFVENTGATTDIYTNTYDITGVSPTNNSNFYFVNNTHIGNSQKAISLKDITTNATAKIYNSIFYYPNDNVVQPINTAVGGKLYINHCNGDFSNLTNDGTTIFINSPYNFAPEFVDPAQGDYHLKLNSPLINLGEELDSGIAGYWDLDDKSRTYAETPPDLGAYELQKYVAYSVNVNNANPADETIDWADTVYVTRKVKFEDDVNLRIEEGTTVLFTTADANVSLENKNSFTTNGSEENPITFKPLNDNLKVVNPINIKSSDLTGDFSYCNFEKFGNMSIDMSNGISSTVILKEGDITFRHCNFIDNEGNAGAAIHSTTGKTKLAFCTFKNNKASDNGGAICLNVPMGDNNQPKIFGSVFYNNSSQKQGGDIFIGSASQLPCNLYYNTHANYHADGFDVGMGYGIVKGSSIMLFGGFAKLNVSNSIFTPRAGEEENLAVELFVGAPIQETLLTITNCNGKFQTNGGGVVVANNTNLAPDFVDLANGDLHLKSTSPLIDRGVKINDNELGIDFDGNPRVIGYNPDLGAYETQAVNLNEDITSHMIWSGEVKVNGTVSIKGAGMVVIQPGTKITYTTPDAKIVLNSEDNVIDAEGTKERPISFTSKEGVTVPRAIDAQAGTLNLKYCNFENFGRNLNSTDDGAIILQSAGAILKHCNFKNNKGKAGAAVYGVQPLNFWIEACNFENNKAENGGALLFESVGTGSEFLIANNLFYKNKASNFGGDVYLSADIPSLTPVTFAFNTHVGSSAAKGANSIFSHNTKANIYNSIFYGIPTNNYTLNNFEEFTVSNCNGGNFSNIPEEKLTAIYDLNPMFVDAENKDFRLLATSPLRNKATGIMVNSPNIYSDAAGNDRYSGGAADLGMYEIQEQDVIGDINGVAEVWEGIIKITGFVNVCENATLTIKPGTQVVFTKPESKLHIGNTAYLIAKGTAENPITFMVESVGNKINQALEIQSKEINLEYCNFYGLGNMEFDESGEQSVPISLSSNKATFNHCNFEGNEGQWSGAIYAIAVKDLNINACIFRNNKSDRNAGAIKISSTMPTDIVNITNCIFDSNSAGNTGGDIYASHNSNFDEKAKITLNYNTFVSSTSTEFGQSIMNDGFDMLIANSIFYNHPNDKINIVENKGEKGTIKIENCNGDFVNLQGIELKDITNFDPEFVNFQKMEYALKLTSPLIDKGNNNIANMPSLDFFGNNRSYGFASDPGAIELIYELTAEAGRDQEICENTCTLKAAPTVHKGTWSVVKGSGDFVNANDNNTAVENIGKGVNRYAWTVTNGIEEITDEVTIINNAPVADAGENIQILANLANPESEVTLSASNLEAGETGEWSYESNFGIVIENPTNPTTKVTKIPHGETAFKWTVKNDKCTAKDEVVVANGYVFNAVKNAKSANWTNSASWDVGQGKTPQAGDSVNIRDAKIIVDTKVSCSKLAVSDNGTLEVKANNSTNEKGRVTTSRIYVEQTAEKASSEFKPAKILVSNGAIDIEKNDNGLTEGLVIGRNGLVSVIPSNNKNASAQITIRRGKSLIVEDPNDELDFGKGGIHVSGGGKIYVEQTAEKTSRAFGRDIHVGNGGKIYIEQTAEKGSEPSEIRVGGGRRIYVEQTAEKNSRGFSRGGIKISGGKLYVEQTAEKRAESYNDLVIGGGGRIYVEQTAEKADIISLLKVPRMLIKRGGRLIVGENGAKNRGKKSVVSVNRIYVEQTAEKNANADTVVLVNSNGKIKVESSAIEGKIYQAKNTLVTVKEGGAIETVYPAKYVMETGSSLVNENQDAEINGTVNRVYKNNNAKLFASPFTKLADYRLSPLGLKTWDESNNDLLNVEEGITLEKGKGYILTNETDKDLYKEFSGTFNTGDIKVNLTAENDGINLIGNPYPSAIDWNEISKEQGTQSTFYIYDFDLHNYRIYQTDGLNFDKATPMIEVGEAFFVVSPAGGNFSLLNSARRHFYTGAKSKRVANSLILNVSNGNYSDKAGFIFEDYKSNSYISSEDAIELPALEENHVSLYSTSGDNYKLAINSCQLPANDEFIPVVFNASTTGDFTISIDENLLSGLDVYLLDIETNEKHNLNENSYKFKYNEANADKNFELRLESATEGVCNDLSSSAKVYSNSNNIYVVSSNQVVNKVEVYSVTGKKLISETFNSSRAVVNTDLPAGVYIVKTYIGNKLHTAKVVI